MPARIFNECPTCGGKYRDEKPLTRIQRRIFDYLTSYIAEHGYAPNFEEIAAAQGYSSLATVHEHLSNLERKGWIRRAYNDVRAITILHEPESCAVEFAAPPQGPQTPGNTK